LTALKLIGGAFLCWIGYQMWRHAPEPLDMQAHALNTMSARRAIRYGFLTFAANPKTAVFFGAVFVGLVPAGTPVAVMALLIAAIFLNETLWYMVVARLFSLSHPRALYIRAKTWIDRIFGTALAIFGLKIAFD
jgi:threonine/homoserine/homoserine lactone efflux protein